MARRVVTDDDVSDDFGDQNPCLLPAPMSAALECAKIVRSKSSSGSSEVPRVSPVWEDGNFKFTNEGERPKWQTEPIVVKLFWSPGEQGDPRIVGKVSVKPDEFEDGTITGAPKTDLAKVCSCIYDVMGPNGTAIRKLCEESVWHAMTKGASKNKAIRDLSVARDKKTGKPKDTDELDAKYEQRWTSIASDLEDAMEPGVKAKMAPKPVIKKRYDPTTGDFLEYQLEFTVNLLTKHEDGHMRTDEETDAMVKGMHADSKLRAWIIDHRDYGWKAQSDKSVTTPADHGVTWRDIVKLGNQYDSLDVVASVDLVPWKVSFSERYYKFFWTVILDDLKIYSVIERGVKQQAGLDDEQRALYAALHGPAAKRARLAE
ncbi:MAG: hypothetical protein ACPGR8_01110 [Limisphaerales bacterium]